MRSKGFRTLLSFVFSFALIVPAATVGQVLTFDQRAEEMKLAADLKERTSRSTEGLVEERLADGSVKVDLRGRFQHVALANLGRDGRPTASCVSSLKEANAFLGRDLETGNLIPNSPRSFDPFAIDSADYGMSDEEMLFYREMIARYIEAAELSPLAANISIVNGDGPNEGFNDPTPVAAEGGNTGATRGQQRLNVFGAAAAIWGAFLDSTVPIEVSARFDPQTCTLTSAVLGSASTTTVHREHANAGFSGTWHHQALANKQAGVDLSPNPDLAATFNSNLDGRPDCLQGTRFYLGLDNSQPPGTLNLLIVVLHEIGHGLGFADFVNGTTGAWFNGFPDVYARFLFDRSTSVLWRDMTDGQRAISAINNNNVLWDGASVRLASGGLSQGRDAATGRVEVYTPAPYDGGSSVAHWNTRVTPNVLMEPFITSGVPLTLDLTRQQMRDIGWYRDSDGNGTPDTITGVTPSGGFLLIGSQANINWNNNGGFNQNVAIELSLNGGATYTQTLAANVANTGSFSFAVPNTPTQQGRIRIREVNYASPAGVSELDFTITNTLPVLDAPFDLDGDGKTDISVFRPNPGQWWYLRSSDGGNRAFAFGSPTDTIVPADFTGDGKTDLAFWRPASGEWFVLRSEDSTFFAFPFGAAGDVPSPADFDGDGKSDATVYRPSTNTWFTLRSSDGQVATTPFGIAGDKPVPADYDGDGKADVAIFRPTGGSGGGEWWYLRSSDGANRAFAFGTSTDLTVPGDYTGDGKADIAYFRPSTGEWFILRSEDSSFFAFPWGAAGDVPAPGDYDGDGKIDAAVFRPSNSNWFALRSTAGPLILQFGITGDKPLPNAFVR